VDELETFCFQKRREDISFLTSGCGRATPARSPTRWRYRIFEVHMSGHSGILISRLSRIIWMVPPITRNARKNDENTKNKESAWWGCKSYPPPSPNTKKHQLANQRFAQLSSAASRPTRKSTKCTKRETGAEEWENTWIFEKKGDGWVWTHEISHINIYHTPFKYHFEAPQTPFWYHFRVKPTPF